MHSRSLSMRSRFSPSYPAMYKLSASGLGFLVLFILLQLGAVSIIRAEQAIEKPTAYVMDRAGI